MPKRTDISSIIVVGNGGVTYIAALLWCAFVAIFIYLVLFDQERMGPRTWRSWLIVLLCVVQLAYMSKLIINYERRTSPEACYAPDGGAIDC